MCGKKLDCPDVNICVDVNIAWMGWAVLPKGIYIPKKYPYIGVLKHCYMGYIPHNKKIPLMLWPYGL